MPFPLLEGNRCLRLQNVQLTRKVEKMVEFLTCCIIFLSVNVLDLFQFLCRIITTGRWSDQRPHNNVKTECLTFFFQSLRWTFFTGAGRSCRPHPSEHHLRDAAGLEPNGRRAHAWQSGDGVRVHRASVRGVWYKRVGRGSGVGQWLWCQCRYSTLHIPMSRVAFPYMADTDHVCVVRRLSADPLSRQRRYVQRRSVLGVGVGLLRPLLRQAEQCAQTQTPQTCSAHQTILGIIISARVKFYCIFMYLFILYLLYLFILLFVFRIIWLILILLSH